MWQHGNKKFFMPIAALMDEKNIQYIDNGLRKLSLASQRGAPYLHVASRWVVQVQVTPDDVELHSQQNHQHAGAVHAHDGACETWGWDPASSEDTQR